MKTKFFGIVLFLILCIAPVAWAHEHRDVGGKFMFIVGFVNEPAFTGTMNGVDVRIMTLRDEQPVEGVEKTLHVAVLREGQKKSIFLPLRPKYKEPGRYAGYFLPTKSGEYVLIFEGEINGISIHEKFKSSDGKFHGVEDPIQFL